MLGLKLNHVSKRGHSRSFIELDLVQLASTTKVLLKYLEMIEFPKLNVDKYVSTCDSFHHFFHFL